jgi:hypothetical protein
MQVLDAGNPSRRQGGGDCLRATGTGLLISHRAVPVFKDRQSSAKVALLRRRNSGYCSPAVIIRRFYPLEVDAINGCITAST